jgi:hypothetical protein
MDEHAELEAHPVRRPRRAAVAATAALLGLSAAVVLAAGPAAAQVSPGAPSGSTPISAVTTTTLNANAGDTGNATAGTVIFIIVTAVLLIGALFVFLQARSNRLKSSG